jgi:hypothetical protein
MFQSTFFFMGFLIFLLSVIFLVKVKLSLALIKRHRVKFYRAVEDSSISILLSLVQHWYNCVRSFRATSTLSLRKERWANIETYNFLKFTYFVGILYFYRSLVLQ